MLAEQEGADRVAGVRERLSLFGRIDSPEDVVDRSIRVYLALKDMACTYGYSFIGVKCQPEMIYRYASCCLAMSLLGNDGIPTACECDTNAALTMYMLHLLSGQPVYFGDTASLDLTTREFKVVNCGGAPTDFAAKPEDVVLTTQYELMGSGRGVVTSFQCRPGEVTLARISRVKGKFVMILARGTAEERPPEAFVQSFKIWPHAFIRLHGDPRVLAREIRSNHIHFVYGDYVAAMVEASRLLGIETTVV